MCGEKNSGEISELQMGIEPKTFQTQIRWSNHWERKN